MIGVLFYVFAALAIGGALGMVLNVRNTVAGAMSLVLTMVSLGGIFVLLEAYFLGVIQILVYAGAIVVLVVDVAASSSPPHAGRATAMTANAATEVAALLRRRGPPRNPVIDDVGSNDARVTPETLVSAPGACRPLARRAR